MISRAMIAFGRAAELIKPGGEVRFCEPAVNSVLLDKLWWLIPVPGRVGRGVPEP